MDLDPAPIAPAALREYLSGADPEAQGAALRGRTDLGGVTLSGASLPGVALAGATLDDVVMRHAVLDEACLDGASLQRADLSGSSLERARAGELDLREALLEDASLKGAMLRFAHLEGALLDHACFDGVDLWGARLDGVEAPGASFRGATLNEASLVGAVLDGAALCGARLQKADLAGARLRGADLTGASLAGASLAGADLSDARLGQLDLADCRLHRVRLADAWLERTRLRIEQLGGSIGEEESGDWDAARRGYLGLEQNFRGLGDPEAASWCYKRARRMAKRESLRLTRLGLRTRAPRLAVRHAAAYLADGFAEWLCDYGESLPRVVRAYVVALLCFSFYYWASGSLLPTGAGASAKGVVPVRDWLDILGFSFLTMCTSSTPDVGLKPASHLVYYVGSVQYIVGVLLIGLFGFVLGNRIRR